MNNAVRPALQTDMPYLAQLFLDVRCHAFTWADKKLFLLEDFYSQTVGEVIFVAEDVDRHILGFISIWCEDSFIHHLFVDPRYQNRGVGKQLLNSLYDWLPFPWTLKCLSANTQALHFYIKNGWKEKSRENGPDGPYLILELVSNPKLID